MAKLEEELEQVTLTHMQDIYQLKKKVGILEEELMIQDQPKSLFILIYAILYFKHSTRSNK